MQNYKGLKKWAGAIHKKVYEALKDEAGKRDIILFDPETVDSDQVYDFPYAYFVDKHSFHVSGVVQKVSGENFTLFHTGEEFGDISEWPISDLSFESAVMLFDYF